MDYSAQLRVSPLASGSRGNAYVVSQGDTYILLECGINKNILIDKLWKLGISITKISACVISHEHKDHSLLLEELSAYMPIYYNGKYTKEIYNNHNIKVYEDNVAFSIGGINFLPLEVNHGECYNCGFEIFDNNTKILFATDFSKFTDRTLTHVLKQQYQEIWIECNYLQGLLEVHLNKIKDEEEKRFRRQLNTHMSVENLQQYLDVFDLSKCKAIYLIHISQVVGDYIVMKCLIQNRYNITTKSIYRNGEKG